MPEIGLMISTKTDREFTALQRYCGLQDYIELFKRATALLRIARDCADETGAVRLTSPDGARAAVFNLREPRS